MKSSKPQFVEERGQKVKLNNLCSRGKSSLRQKDVSNDGPYAVYGASGLVGTMASFQNAVPYVAVVKDGAGVGRASACEAKTSVLGTMQALIPSEGIDRDYLLHLVRSLHLGDGFSGSTIPHIYFKDYGKLPVRLHSPAEQKRIVDIFASIERQIKVSKQQLGVCQSFWAPPSILCSSARLSVICLFKSSRSARISSVGGYSIRSYFVSAYLLKLKS